MAGHPPRPTNHDPQAHRITERVQHRRELELLRGRVVERLGQRSDGITADVAGAKTSVCVTSMPMSLPPIIVRRSSNLCYGSIIIVLRIRWAGLSNRARLDRHLYMSTKTTREHPHLRATLLLSCLAQFMVILDVSVVNVALPAIRNGLHFSEQDLQWVVNAYTVTFAGFLLLGGRAADLLGRRRVFVSGLTLFGLASLAGGFADTKVHADRGPRGAGPRRRDDRARFAVDPHDDVRGRPGPQPRGRDLGRDGRRRGRGRRAPRRGAHRPARLALDPVHQRADRPDRGGPGPALSSSPGRAERSERNFDLAGAFTATLGLSLLVLGIVRTDVTGWGSIPTLGAHRRRHRPARGVRRDRGPIRGGSADAAADLRAHARLRASNVVVLLVGAAHVRDVVLRLAVPPAGTRVLADARRAGVPPDVLSIVVGSTLASRCVARFGAKPLLVAGMGLAGLGLLSFTPAVAHGTYLGEVLVPRCWRRSAWACRSCRRRSPPSRAWRPTRPASPRALVNTSRLFGGALGLAILARSPPLTPQRPAARGGGSAHAALNERVRVAFAIARLRGLSR